MGSIQNIKRIVEYIDLKEIPISFSNCYDSAMKYKHCNSVLNGQDLEKALYTYKLDNAQDFKLKIFECYEEVKSDEILKEFFYVLYYILFEDYTEQIKDIWNIKSSLEVFKEKGSYRILSLILLLGAYNHHNYNMERRGFNHEQIDQHINIIHDILLNDEINYNLNGIRFSQMVWGAYFVNARIIQVGRLQYELDVWKNDKYNLKENVTLRENDYYIKIHIPKLGKLNEKEVHESIKDSKKYIRRYFFELANKDILYFCHSWILSPELKMFLNKDSNILNFQKLFNIIGKAEAKEDFYNFVFDMPIVKVNDVDLKTKTSLQRAVKNYILNGGILHEGFGMLKEKEEKK